jgi:uncharacterized protein YbjT (DUF2867 family)
MEKIIVLGATGNIGTAVLQNLQNRNVEVFAGVRSESGFDKVEALGASPVMVNFNDQDSLNEALKGMQRVFLVTPLMQNPEAVTQMVINACKKNGIKHLVRSTASGADSKGQIRMARWAGASEDLIKESGVNYTILRPASFLQNFINYHSYTIKEHSGFYAPIGDAKYAMIDIYDLGEIAALALTGEGHFGKTYDLSGLSYNNQEIARTLSEVVGKKVSYIDIPDEMAKESMLSNHMPEWMVEAMMELNYIIKQGWAAAYSDDFRNITGREYTSAQAFFEKNKNAFIQ